MEYLQTKRSERNEILFWGGGDILINF
jgi:hypothetical protein